MLNATKDPEKEYVRPLSFDFVLKKIIEKEERKIIILN